MKYVASQSHVLDSNRKLDGIQLCASVVHPQSPILTSYRRQVFEAIDFPAVTAGNNSAEDFVLQPPETDPTKPMGKQIRAKLLRAWIEISAWLTIYQKSSKWL